MNAELSKLLTVVVFSLPVAVSISITFSPARRAVANEGEKHPLASLDGEREYRVALAREVFALVDRVAKAKEVYSAQKVYSKGCSGYVCEVLGISWEDANALMGDNPKYVGSNNKYEGLTPGDVVGWKNPSGSGHVAVYIGESGEKFLDVRSENEKPRKIVNGYGGQKLYKSSRF